MPAPIIIKADGQLQRFSHQKLKSSLLKCGLDQKCAQNTAKEVSQQLSAEMTSRNIFNLTHQKLKKINRPIAYRYSLKQAIFELGPSGFHFEQIISRLFKKLEYKTQTNLIIQGKCIRHEVDCVLEKPGELSWVECKFHNVPGTISDVKIALYVYARFIDLKEFKDDSIQKSMWLVSNTRFSSDAIDFAKCRGLKMIGWEYPAQLGLNVLLEKYKLYPVTTISSLSRKMKLNLLQNEIYTTQEFLENRKQVLRSGVSESKWVELCTEIEQLHENDS